MELYKRNFNEFKIDNSSGLVHVLPLSFTLPTLDSQHTDSGVNPGKFVAQLTPINLLPHAPGLVAVFTLSHVLFREANLLFLRIC